PFCNGPLPPFGSPVGTRSPLIVGTGQSLQVSDQNVGFLSVRSRVQGTGAVEQATADLSSVCHATIHHGCPLGDPPDPTRGVRVCVTQSEGRVGLGQTRPGTRVLGRRQDRECPAGGVALTRIPGDGTATGRADTVRPDTGA